MANPMIPNKHRRRLLEFAHEHMFIIHPGKGFEYYLEGFHKFQHCPCDDKRATCPCEEAIQEVVRDGYCKCRLFWVDHIKYAEEMIPLPKEDK